jgi:hypothetical protein
VNIELCAIDAIRPYDQNPRLNDAAVASVAASLKEFGFRQARYAKHPQKGATYAR